MASADATRELEQPEVSPSPFRKAFDRARSDALQGPGGPLAAVEAPRFEYRLVKRTGKRSADEADWNRFGRKGWELVGLTRRHAAFKRPLLPNVSR